MGEPHALLLSGQLWSSSQASEATAGEGDALSRQRYHRGTPLAGGERRRSSPQRRVAIKYLSRDVSYLIQLRVELTENTSGIWAMPMREGCGVTTQGSRPRPQRGDFWITAKALAWEE